MPSGFFYDKIAHGMRGSRAFFAPMCFLAANERLCHISYAAVAELADALDSKSSGSNRAGSSPASGISLIIQYYINFGISVFFIIADYKFL